MEGRENMGSLHASCPKLNFAVNIELRERGRGGGEMEGEYRVQGEQ